MNNLQFFGLRFVLNFFSVFIACSLFLYGMNTSNVLQTVAPTFVLIVFAGIGIKNVPSKGALTSLSEVVVCAAMYLWYMHSIKTHADLLASNMLLIQLARGFIVLTSAILVIRLVHRSVGEVIKSAQVYSLVYGTGVMISLVNCVKNFKSSLSIPVFNGIIRKACKSIFNSIKGSLTEDGEESQGTVSRLLTGLQESKFGKASGKLLKIYAEYPDECILAYCYKNKDMPMYQATLQGMGIFLKNAPIILAQIAALTVLNFVIRGCIYVIMLVIVYNYGILSLRSCVFYLLLTYCVQFLVKESFLDPLLMTAVIKTFLSKADQETEDVSGEVEELFPGLDKLRKMFGVKGDAPRDSVGEPEVDSGEVVPEEVSSDPTPEPQEVEQPEPEPAPVEEQTTSETPRQEPGINVEDVMI